MLDAHPNLAQVIRLRWQAEDLLSAWAHPTAQIGTEMAM
jgi:hypothetical protein